MKQYTNSLSYSIRQMQIGDSLPIYSKCIYKLVWHCKKDMPGAQFRYTANRLIRIA